MPTRSVAVRCPPCSEPGSGDPRSRAISSTTGGATHTLPISGATKAIAVVRFPGMHTGEAARPTVALFTGTPGTGKTTLAELTAARLEAPVFGWDWAMAALTWCEPIQAALRSLDHQSYRRVGWSILWNLAEAQLRLGHSVVLDGVARDPEVAGTRDLARHNGARSVIVMSTCQDTERLRRRIEGRQRAIPGWHELTWEHVESYQWVPPTDLDLVVDTAQDPEPTGIVQQIIKLVTARPS